MPKKETNGDARSQALAWYVERLDGKLSPEDEAAFNNWLAADPAHRQEYSQLDALCEQLGAFEDAPQVAQAKAYAARYRSQAAKARRLAGLGKAPWQGLAAAGLAVVFGVWLVWGQGSSPSGQDRYATAFGEQRTVSLADGSTVQLNTLSSVEIAYSDVERRVTLNDGQVSFDVAPDASRPFVVTAGDGIVTAIGTKFDVYRTGERVTVTLLEGIVEVRQRASVAVPLPAPTTSVLPAGSQPGFDAPSDTSNVTEKAAPLRTITELRPGEQISIGQGGALSTIAQVDVGRVVAWKDGNIDFHDTLLRDAIAEVNRYSELKLVLEDDDLADIEVSGIFKIGRPKNFIRALETRFGLRAVPTSGNRILLRPPLRG